MKTRVPLLARLPISMSAPLVVGIPVLVVGVWLSVMWNRQSHKAVRVLADQNIQQIHEMAATKVVDVLSMPVRVCQLNQHLIVSGSLPASDLPRWRSTLLEQAKAFDMLSAISWGSADGRAAWVSRYADGSYYWAIKQDPDNDQMVEWRIGDDGTIAPDPTNQFDFDLFSRPWFQTPQQANAAAWSQPFVWVGGVDSGGVTLGISYGIPIYTSDRELLGVIDADYSLNDLSRFLQSMQIGKTGIAVLMSSNGDLLAVSADIPIVTPGGQRISGRDSADLRLAAAANLLGSDDSDQRTQTGVSLDDQVHLVRISSVGKELGLDWRLVTIIPEEDFTAEIEREFQRSWTTSLVAVLLAISVGLVAARWLVAPLVKLVTAVRRIGQGDLDTQIKIFHAPEYTNLADEINAMTSGLRDRVRMRDSLSLAMEVQQNLLPDNAPAIGGLDISGHSTYCDETGGDYYDFLDVSGGDEETVVIALGDVMGHGVAAAMLMATARGILRSRCSEPGSLADFLDHLNGMLVNDTRGQRFMTMLLLTVSATRDEFRWASAGHGAPIVYDITTDRFLELDGGGLPLGIMEEETYEEYVQSGVRSGFLFLAATDGLWETVGENGLEFGMDRVRQLLRKHAARPAAEISDLIRDTLARFRGPGGQDDDLTFVIAKLL